MANLIENNPIETAYLVGAGISSSAPSNLPVARDFIVSFVKSITDEPSWQTAILDRVFVDNLSKRFDGDFLRFETIITCIKNSIDPNISILKVYSDCTLPNPCHFFLAKQISQGAIVLTTNFDNLIEIACQILGVKYSLVVSDDELLRFSEKPEEFVNPLIKLHGAYDPLYSEARQLSGPINIKTTMDQFGRVYLDETSRQLIQAFSAVLKIRHLVVLGYSGCDDFDIIPLLMQSELKKGFTWIEHKKQQPEVITSPIPSSPDLPPYRLLKKNHLNSAETKIIRGETATILGIKPSDVKTAGHFTWANVFSRWKEECLPTDVQKQLVFSQILIQINQSIESIKILESIPQKFLSDTQQTFLIYTLCDLYFYFENEDDAILKLSELAENDKHSLKGFAYYTLARINSKKRDYELAFMYLETAMKFFKEQDDIVRMSDALHELGRINLETGNISKGIEYLEMAKQTSIKLGLLADAAIGYGEIARALYKEGNLTEAENYAHKAIEISTLSGDQASLGRSYHCLGYIYSQTADFFKAIEMFKQAIEYERIATARLDLAHSLHSLGNMYLCINEFEEAQKYLQESIEIKKQLNDKKGIENSELLLRYAARS